MTLTLTLNGKLKINSIFVQQNIQYINMNIYCFMRFTIYGGCSQHILFNFSSIFPSPDQEMNSSLMPAAHSTGGSLPDLTNIQFPPPLPTPLDLDDPITFPTSSSSSTSNLTTNLTHLGISAASHVPPSPPAQHTGPVPSPNISLQQPAPTLPPAVSPQIPIAQVSLPP